MQQIELHAHQKLAISCIFQGALIYYVILLIIAWPTHWPKQAPVILYWSKVFSQKANKKQVLIWLYYKDRLFTQKDKTIKYDKYYETEAIGHTFTRVYYKYNII